MFGLNKKTSIMLNEAQKIFQPNYKKINKFEILLHSKKNINIKNILFRINKINIIYNILKNELICFKNKYNQEYEFMVYFSILIKIKNILNIMKKYDIKIFYIKKILKEKYKTIFIKEIEKALEENYKIKQSFNLLLKQIEKKYYINTLKLIYIENNTL